MTKELKLTPLQLLILQLYHTRSEIERKMQAANELLDKGDLTFDDWGNINARCNGGASAINGILQSIVDTKVFTYHAALKVLNNHISTSIMFGKLSHDQFQGGLIDYPMIVLTVHDNPLSNFLSQQYNKTDK